MKTHDVAKALMHLSRILRAGPNVPLEDVGNLGVHADTSRITRSSKENRSGDTREKGTALALLAEIASYSKSELAETLRLLDLPVEVKNTDSVRDLLGRTLKFIADNPAARQKLVAPTTDEAGASPVLARALSILLNQP